MMVIALRLIVLYTLSRPYIHYTIVTKKSYCQSPNSNLKTGIWKSSSSFTVLKNKPLYIYKFCVLESVKPNPDLDI